LFSRGASILAELEFGDVRFSEGRKTGDPGEKPSEESGNQQQTHPTYGTAWAGIESRPHWRETSSLTTAPTPLP